MTGLLLLFSVVVGVPFAFVESIVQEQLERRVAERHAQD